MHSKQSRNSWNFEQTANNWLLPINQTTSQCH